MFGQKVYETAFQKGLSVQAQIGNPKLQPASNGHFLLQLNRLFFFATMTLLPALDLVMKSIPFKREKYFPSPIGTK